MTKTLMQLLKWPRGNGSQNAGSSNPKDSTNTRLLKWDEVDEYQQSNPFIRSGYRGRLNLPSCLLSTLSFHNETINIWTHLLGFIFFLVLLVRDVVVLPSLTSVAEITLADLLVLVGMLVCYQACMILSSLFHTFTCHSKTVSERCLSLDLIGITLALLATYLSGIYFAFGCHAWWRDFYLYTVGGIFALAAGAQLHPRFSQENYAPFRIGLFVLWAAYGIIPTLHWVWLHSGGNDGANSPIVSLMLPRIAVMYALCGIGFLFYITKLPERAVPGLVDIIGHSHQWWHIFIFLALLFWHQTGVNLALYHIQAGCGGQDDRVSEEVMAELRMWPF